MTRPKVDPDKRQRTAQACDSCKRRKQKCNGVRPCNTCSKRHLECLYTPTTLNHSDLQDPDGSPTKRRHVDDSPGMVKSSTESCHSTTGHTPSLSMWNQLTDNPEMQLNKAETSGPKLPAQIGVNNLISMGDSDFDSRSKISNTSGAADEAEVLPSKRMLEDQTGRLLYLGDSATLSYLQYIRLIVYGVLGNCDFTEDPNRHRIMEKKILLSGEVRPTGVLPDQKTARVLADSFFINTAGFVEVFSRTQFLHTLDECYKDPLSSPPSMLCLIYLVFAIGLVMAAPFPNTDEAAVIDKLRLNPDRPELFFRNAKSLADPVSGFEDSDFWSVQALLLMSLYMLAVSKRNASYAYYGMAVRSAFALGLHREEPTSLFQNHQNVARRNMWRTLFILDRFLAACLGRPTAISEADCSERALDPFDPPVAADESPMSSNADTVHLEAVEASVQSCNVIGITLRDVYSKRKISTAVAQAIAVHLDEWPKKLPPSLHWRRIWNGPIHPTEGISILHANLLHCHSVMLLTRPFFLYIINKAGKHDGRKMPRLSPRMDNFGQACAEASQHTIVLAKAALDGHYLPRCNPFVIHCVFAAALIILSNEFAHLYHNPDARESIESSKEILEFCAVQDAQANRVAFIVKAFDQANVERLPTARKLSLSGRHTPTLATLSQNSRLDPIAAFFRKEKETRHHEHFSSAAAHEDRPGMASTLPPSTSIPPMVPSAIQQPSPEGSISLNSNLAVPGIPSGADVLATDTEFDFDSLWNNWGAPPAPRMVLPPTIHPEGDFGQYGMVQPLMPPGNSIINNAGPMFVP